MSIGDRIRTLREKLHMTQAALARKIGVSRATVNAWETERNRPEHYNMRALAKALGCTEMYLEYGDTPDRLSDPKGQTLVYLFQELDSDGQVTVYDTLMRELNRVRATAQEPSSKKPA